jgi:predicted TIM-barrel enzyme
VETVASIVALADGAIVGSAVKSGGGLFGELDAQRARAFMSTVAALRTK